jgi:hypothetical protein
LTVDFETPVCKLYLLFISAGCPRKIKKRRKCCCPLVFQSLQPIQYLDGSAIQKYKLLKQQFEPLVLIFKIPSLGIECQKVITTGCKGYIFPFLQGRGL